MSKKQKRQKVFMAVMAGLMAVLMLLPILLQGLSML